MTKTNRVLAITLALATASGAPAMAATPPQPVRFTTARDFTLHFEHDLGADEAKRRVASRIETLRRKYGSRLEAADVSWNGNEADIRVRALSQGANAHVSVGDRTVDVRIHLPLLLSAFGDQVRKVLNTSALDALKTR